MRLYRKSAAFFVLFVLFLAASQGLFATRAVLEKRGFPNWYGAYLLPGEGGGEDLATLRRGLEVEIIKKGTRRHKVRLLKFPDRSMVIVHKAGWPGGGPAEGWVSTRFLRLLPEPSQSNSEIADDPFSDLAVAGETSAATARDDSQYDDHGTPSSAAEAGQAMLGPRGADPGNEDWRKRLPNVYYVLIFSGRDETYFTILGKGYTSLYAGRRKQRKSNYIERRIRRDIQAVGRPRTMVVRVKVHSSSHVLDIMKKGLVPPGGRVKTRKVYEYDELQPSQCNIVGFCTIAHGSTDGPVINSGGTRDKKQMYFKYWFDDGKISDFETLQHRLVKGARISFYNCNSGACQYSYYHTSSAASFYDTAKSSLAHLLAAYYSDKKVVVRGKLAIGSPNSSDKAYAIFGPDEKGRPVRLKPKARYYKFYAPRMDWEDPKDNRRKWAYGDIIVPWKNEEEKKALLEFYRDCGVKARIDGKRIKVKALRIGRVSRNSTKDPLLMKIVRVMADRPRQTRWRRFWQFLHIADDSPEYERLKSYMPQLQSIFEDSDLQEIIEQVKEDNHGVLDPDDFRIWFRLYFRNFKFKDRQSVVCRACLCNVDRMKVH